MHTYTGLSRVLKHLFMSRVLACILHRLFYFRRLLCANTLPRAIECQGRYGGNYPVELSGVGGTYDRIPSLSINRAMEHVSPGTSVKVSQVRLMRGDRHLETQYLNETQRCSHLNRLCSRIPGPPYIVQASV